MQWSLAVIVGDAWVRAAGLGIVGTHAPVTEWAFAAVASQWTVGVVLLRHYSFSCLWRLITLAAAATALRTPWRNPSASTLACCRIWSASALASLMILAAVRRAWLSSDLTWSSSLRVAFNAAAASASCRRLSSSRCADACCWVASALMSPASAWTQVAIGRNCPRYSRL